MVRRLIISALRDKAQKALGKNLTYTACTKPS